MRVFLIIAALGAVGWVGWDYYEDRHFDTPDIFGGFLGNGFGVGVSLGVGDSIKGMAAKFGGGMQ